MRVLTAFAIGAVSAGTLVFYIVNRSHNGQLAEWRPVPPVTQQAAPRVVEPAPSAPVETAPTEAPEPARVQTAQPVRIAASKPKRKPKIFTPVVNTPEPEPTPAVAEFPAPPEVPVASPAPPAAVPTLNETAQPIPPEPQQVTLEPGTLLVVRLSEEISSDTHATGETFAATLDQPLVVNGFVIAEKGSRAEGKVVAATEAGRVKGSAGLEIQLTRFNTADGQKILIATDSFEKKMASSKSADLAKVGAAAAIGVAIGAAIGGGKGAAIGGAAGGATGIGTVLGTKGKSISLPSETRITFRLNSPVTITERL